MQAHSYGPNRGETGGGGAVVWIVAAGLLAMTVVVSLFLLLAFARERNQEVVRLKAQIGQLESTPTVASDPELLCPDAAANPYIRSGYLALGVAGGLKEVSTLGDFVALNADRKGAIHLSDEDFYRIIHGVEHLLQADRDRNGARTVPQFAPESRLRGSCVDPDKPGQFKPCRGDK